MIDKMELRGEPEPEFLIPQKPDIGQFTCKCYAWNNVPHRHPAEIMPFTAEEERLQGAIVIGKIRMYLETAEGVEPIPSHTQGYGDYPILLLKDGRKAVLRYALKLNKLVLEDLEILLAKGERCNL